MRFFILSIFLFFGCKLFAQHDIYGEDSIKNNVRFIDEIFFSFNDETYEVDSSWINKVERYYSKDGRREKVIQFDRKGKKSSSTIWKYDSKGQVLLKEIKDSATITYQSINKYDSLSMCIYEEVYSSFDSIITKVIWSYINDSTTSKMKVISKSKNKQKRKNNVIDIRLPERESKFSVTTIGENGLDKKIRLYSKGMKLLHENVSKYNEDGLLFFSELKNRKGKTMRSTKIEYEDGKKKRVYREYDFFGKDYTQTTEFDMNENIIIITTKTNKGVQEVNEYKYRYNDKGDWTKKTEYLNRNPFSLTLRYIEYYD